MSPGITAPVESRPGDPAEPFRHLKLSGRSLAADGKTFQAGAGVYTLQSGRLSEIVTGDGRPAGWFFAGSGQLVWTADEPAGVQVYGRNAKRVGGFDARSGGLGKAFSEAVFLFSKAATPAFGEAVAEASPVAAEAFAKQLGRFRADLVEPYEGALAAAGSTGSFFVGLLGSDARHRVDDVTDDEETLVHVDRPSGLPMGYPDARFGSTIAHQSLGRPRRSVPRVPFTLLHVDADVRDTGEIYGHLAVEERIRLERPAATLAFELDSVDRWRNGKMLVTRLAKVTDDTGAALPFTHDRSLLVVFLPGILPAGTTKKLRFEYEAPFFERVGGDNYWELQIASGWYPQPRSLNAANHTFHAVVRTPKGFTAFGAGDTVRRATEGDVNVYEVNLDRPVPFANLLAGKYTIEESTVDGFTCRVASYGMAKAQASKKLLDIFHNLRKFYSWLLGPFPWKEYTIVEINTFGFGQAPPAMMRITKEAFESTSMTDDVAAIFSQGINHRFAHEIAHSYFGYVVNGASRADQWIEESFSESVSSYAIERLKDKGDAKALAIQWKSRAKEATKTAPIFYANDIARKISLYGDQDASLDRTFLVYHKGAHVLQTMRLELGDDLYFTVIRSFLRNFEKKRNVTTEEFIALANFVTKKDWKPFFEKYYYGIEMP
ncbi:MAG: hypothetical protein JNK60_01375 [Acidobacteria bacterium]|nr:hypothetical protein [Acidobacteriota bacterium]